MTIGLEVDGYRFLYEADEHNENIKLITPDGTPLIIAKRDSKKDWHWADGELLFDLILGVLIPKEQPSLGYVSLAKTVLDKLKEFR